MGKVSETADDPLFETQLRIHFATFPYSIDIQININTHIRLDGGDVLTTSKLGVVMCINIHHIRFGYRYVCSVPSKLTNLFPPTTLHPLDKISTKWTLGTQFQFCAKIPFQKIF